MALSIAFHSSLLLLIWASTLYEPPQLEFVTYEVELVSPAPARQAEEPQEATEEIVIERPDPEPTPPEPEPEEVVPVQDPEAEPEPEVEEVEEPPVEEPPEVAEEAVVATTDRPVEEEPEVSGEGLNVRIEGLRRDYPEYYNNIIRQIQRCFRWTGGGRWRTTLFFYITRDGNAEDIDFVERSGNTAFDFEAMGAVECAGRGRFGPLPEDLPFDRFPFLFDFTPGGAPVLMSPEVVRPSEVGFER